MTIVGSGQSVKLFSDKDPQKDHKKSSLVTTEVGGKYSWITLVASRRGRGQHQFGRHGYTTRGAAVFTDVF